MSFSHSLEDLTDTREIHDLYPTFQGELAFDVGANGGHLANVFARLFTTVIACEPSDEPYNYLVSHAAANVKALNVAVTSHDGPLALQQREMSEQRGYLFTGNSLREWGNLVAEVEVEGVTLDTLTATYGTPDFVKIDTEGHEALVVRGGTDTFATRPAFLIEIHSVDNGNEIAGLLTDWGLPFREVRHESHEVGTDAWLSHYWITSEGA
jgi:FkbM family methyltransferase